MTISRVLFHFFRWIKIAADAFLFYFGTISMHERTWKLVELLFQSDRHAMLFENSGKPHLHTLLNAPLWQRRENWGGILLTHTIRERSWIFCTLSISALLWSGLCVTFFFFPVENSLEFISQTCPSYPLYRLCFFLCENGLFFSPRFFLLKWNMPNREISKYIFLLKFNCKNLIIYVRNFFFGDIYVKKCSKRGVLWEDELL